MPSSKRHLQLLLILGEKAFRLVSLFSRRVLERPGSPRLTAMGRSSVAFSSWLGDTELFLNYLRQGPGLTLSGFDFPIGLPEVYGKKTGLGDFCSALDAFGYPTLEAL
jgi:hypothetical protein